MNAPLSRRGIVVSFLAPCATLIRRRDGVIVGWGLAPGDVETLRAPAVDVASAAVAICRQRGDVSLLYVTAHAGRPTAINAWKGLTSCHELFFSHRDGCVIVADHFRNMMAALPPARRVPGPAALADHFIFRTIPAPRTISAEVERLGRGEALLFDPAAGHARRSTFDRAETPNRKAPLETHVDRVEAALGRALAPYCDRPGIANLFSGGVDSTLIHSYLGRDVPAVHYVLPMFRREFERRYADEAAHCLGLSLHKVKIPAGDYLSRLTRVIRLTGTPPPHLQFGFYTDLFGLGHDTFVMGEQGDALFGLSVRKVKAASRAATPARVRLLEALAPLVPRSRRRRFCLVPNTARRLMVDVRDPAGYASRMGVYTDDGMLAATFGTDVLADRLEARRTELDRMACLAAPADDRFLAHVEAAQLVDYLTEDMVTTYRHLAHAQGKSLAAPFLDRAVFDAALAVPPAERYARGLQGKYLLKAVLRRRVPSYPVDQRKGYSGIELAALHPEGPLADVWRHYPLPDLFDDEIRPLVMGGSGPMTWNAITLAVWQREIADCADLEPLPGTRQITWPEAQELAAPGPAAAASRRRC